LCDFNLAKEGIKDNARALSFCGSPLYLSPEMLGNAGVGKAADVFGIGLIMYEIETGLPAFYAKTPKDLYDKISTVTVDYEIKNIDENIKELMKHILVKNEHERYTLEEIKMHNYFEGFDWEKTKKRENGFIKIVKRKDRKRKTETERQTATQRSIQTAQAVCTSKKRNETCRLQKLRSHTKDQSATADTATSVYRSF
jgi:serum/glucocorticoid-regulated kinase 2